MQLFIQEYVMLYIYLEQQSLFRVHILQVRRLRETAELSN